MTAQRRSDVLAGGSLAAASALTILAMAHHPTGHSSALGPVVHGAMIALLAVMTAGFVRHAQREGLEKFATIAALVAFALGTVAHLGAGTINGFVVPAMAARDLGDDVFAAAWAMNQALAREGAFLASAAFLLWGLQLLSGRRSVFDRVTGLAGLAAGGGAVALLGMNALQMDVKGAFIIYSLHALFGVLAGLRLCIGARENTPG